ncbi:uncharacterized protein LOC110882328 [Helianthus annuus]|uniref:uncharacterized protein LOC110882328 n=1 Tax=Helianthus annuus TaxID=4232 RepID=UPI000B9074FE|nr:uncharacterized protein LOC110882328 [Helianthus annuus]
MNIITCLVLNRPYNISQVLFDHMVGNISSERYIMYPRFIQMMIDDQVTDLPKDPADVMNLRNMKVETLSRLDQYKLKKDETEPRAKHMICKIANPIYVAPENDAWRHDNSNSEDETDSLRDMHEKKLRYWFMKDGKRKRTPKASPIVIAPKVPKPKIVVKGIVERGSHKRMLDPSEIIQQGVGLMKESLEGFPKKTEVATKTQVESSAKHFQPEKVKEKEPEGVAHTDSSDAEDESTETESEVDKSKIGHGKVMLKKKPQKKRKGSDEEDSTYTPTAEEKKELRTKRKAVQSGVIPRNPEKPEAVKEQNIEVPEVQSVEKPEAEKEKAPESPDYVRIEKKGADDAETSRPKKNVLPDQFEGFPNVRGEFTDDILPDEDYDMFHDETVKDLKKKVSILKKEKAKAEADRDELKKQLEELSKANEEIKTVVVKYAKKIKMLGEDVDDNAKLFEQLSLEITDLHLKNKNLNETNQTLHQMLQKLHEASASEIKLLKLEIEALRADKILKDEQLNMLYIVMEHHLGINVQSVYNSLEIQRVEERRA